MKKFRIWYFVQNNLCRVNREKECIIQIPSFSLLACAKKNFELRQ